MQIIWPFMFRAITKEPGTPAKLVACVGAREHYYLVPGSLPSPAGDPAWKEGPELLQGCQGAPGAAVLCRLRVQAPDCPAGASPFHVAPIGPGRAAHSDQPI